MSLDYPPAVFRPPFRRAFRLPFRSPAGIETVIASAIGDYNENGIVTDGSGFVTAWNNSSSVVGALPDFDTQLGTLSNSSVTTVNGHDAVATTGAYALETSAGVDIASGGTVFVVARYSDAGLPAAENIFDARSEAVKRWLMRAVPGGTDRFAFFQGGTVQDSSGIFDDNPHIHTAQFNGDPTSKYTVSGVGNVTADAGPDVWDVGSLFSDRAGGGTMKGYIAQLLAFDFKMRESLIAQIEFFLLEKFSI